jgi:hypothetical protein
VAVSHSSTAGLRRAQADAQVERKRFEGIDHFDAAERLQVDLGDVRFGPRHDRNRRIQHARADRDRLIDAVLAAIAINPRQCGLRMPESSSTSASARRRPA